METLGKARRRKVLKVDWVALVDDALGDDEKASECPKSESTLPEGSKEVDDDSSACSDKCLTPIICIANTTVVEPRELFPVFVNSTPTPRGTENRKRKADSDELAELKRPKRARRRGNRDRKENMQQLYLDLGQKTFGHVTCKVCGMVYTYGQADDQSEHYKFHRRFLSGVKFPGWKSERIVEEFHGGRIILVLPTDPKQHLRKVEEIRQLVDSELGYATGTTLRTNKSKTFLYASQKRLMGCVIAEEICEGYEVLTPEGESDCNSLDGLSAWFCSTTPQPASVGINRMWVSAQCRRRGVASRLLDSVRSNFLPGCVVPRNKIAFSDPTPDGKAFAVNYCRTQNFLVYRWL